MGSSTLERGPTISGVGDMDMEERDSGNPSDQPCQDQQTTTQKYSWWRHQLKGQVDLKFEGIKKKRLIQVWCMAHIYALSGIKRDTRRTPSGVDFHDKC